MVEDKYRELVKQVEPSMANENNGKIMEYAMDNGYYLYPVPLNDKELSSDASYIERAKENGFVAIVNDGKLLGFKKETA